MQLIDYYSKLQNILDVSAETSSIKISLLDISNIFDCTVRNTKLVLRKLEDENWIHWIPGRGRGNQSRIQLLKSLDQLKYERAQQFVENRDLLKAMDIMNQISSPAYRSRFLNWLYSQFGYRNEAYETLRFPVFRELETLDPAFTGCGIETHLVRHIFDCLVYYDSLTGNMKPQLAHHWESNADHSLWTFYLRKGVCFHDGSEVTSEDVAFSLNRIQDPLVSSPYQWLFKDIVNINKIGPYCVQIQLANPNAMFLHHISFHAASIISADSVRNDTALIQNIVGTGPFKRISQDHAMYCFEANTSYFLGRPHIDRFEVWILKDLQALQLGKEPDEFQLTYLRDTTNSIPCEWKNIRRLEKGCKLLVLNLNKPGPMKDIRFREAIFNAINPLNLIENLGSQDLHPAFSFLPDMEVSSLEADFDKGVQSLSRSTYHGEVIQVFCYDHHKYDAEIIKQQCKSIGIHVEVTLLTYDDRLSPDIWREADLILYQALFDDDTVFSILEAFQTKSSFLSICMDRNLIDMKDSFVSKLQRCSSNQECINMIQSMEKALYEQFAFLYLYRKEQTYYYDPTLKGVTLSSLGWVEFKDLFVQKM